MKIEIISVDFDNDNHCDAVFELMNMYMQDPMGNANLIAEDHKHRLIDGLKQHPTAISLLAYDGSAYIGLLNAFINFSTFKLKKMINIHDIIVHTDYRGIGIGRKMMMGIEQLAKNIDCAKITLEVRNDNSIAQELYASLGYVECEPPMFFWTKLIDSK